MKKTGSLLWIVILAAVGMLLLGACKAQTPEPTPTLPPTKTAAPTPTPSPTPSPADAVQEGDLLYHQGDFAGAIDAYQRAIEIDDQHAPAYSGLSRVYGWEIGGWKEALENAQKGAELAPESAYAQAVLAEALIDAYSENEALKAAKKASELDPEDAYVQSVLAAAYLEGYQYDEALKAAEKAYELDAGSADALRALSRVYYRTADFGRSQAALRKAIELEPGIPEYEVLLGDLYLETEDFSAADAAYARVLERSPEHLSTQISQAISKIYQKDYKSAETLLEKLSKEYPDKAAVLYAFAVLYSNQEDYKEALGKIDAALDIDPDPLYLKEVKASIYQRQGECDQGRRILLDLLEEHPEVASIQAGLGYAELCAGDMSKALDRFRGAADLDAFDGSAQRGMGLAYTSQQRYDDAENALLESLRLSPALSTLHGDLASVFWSQGLVEEAEAEFRIGIELNPYELYNSLRLAGLLIDQNRPGEAVELANQAWEIDAENLDVLAMVGMAYFFDGDPGKASYYLGRVAGEDPENGWNHYLLGLAERDRGEFSAASDEINTYLALDGSSMDENTSGRVGYLIDALDNGYWMAEDKALEDLGLYQDYFFQQKFPTKVEDREGGRTLVVTVPLTQAQIDSQEYLTILGQVVGINAFVVPRIDPLVENGQELRLTRGGQEFLVVKASLELLKQILDGTIDETALSQRLELNLTQGSTRAINLDKIMRGMAEQRKIEIETAPAIEKLSREELQAYLDSSVDEEVSAAIKDDETVLELLEVITPSLDLEKQMIDLYSEQIAGIYDPDVKTMFLVELEQTSAEDQIVIAHETVHALQDQKFDLNKLQDSAANDDQSLAIDALIEGDATLGSIQYLQENIPQVELMVTASMAGELESEALESAPDFLRGMSGFPYISGQEFVQSIFDSKGWEGVNAAFESPPLSSEQILHPERYLSDHRPVEVTLPELAETLGDPWSEADSDVFGEYTLQLILEGYIGPSSARWASDGWGGDRYILLEGDQAGSSILALKTVWDDRDEADAFWHSLRLSMQHRPAYNEVVSELVGDLRQRTWQREGTTVIFLRQVDDIWVLVGTDPEALQKLADGL